MRSLLPGEYTTYELRDGEAFDYSEFTSSCLFAETAKPIDKVLVKVKLQCCDPDTDNVILTARGDFDNRDAFCEALLAHGINAMEVYVARTGNSHEGTVQSRKVDFVRRTIASGAYDRVRMFDDSTSNLQAFLGLRDEYPKLHFDAFLVHHGGEITTYG